MSDVPEAAQKDESEAKPSEQAVSKEPELKWEDMDKWGSRERRGKREVKQYQPNVVWSEKRTWFYPYHKASVHTKLGTRSSWTEPGLL